MTERDLSIAHFDMNIPSLRNSTHARETLTPPTKTTASRPSRRTVMNGSKKRVHFELRASRLSFDVSADVSTLLSNAPASFAFHLSFDRSMRSLRGDQRQSRELGSSRGKWGAHIVTPMMKMMTLNS